MESLKFDHSIGLDELNDRIDKSTAQVRQGNGDEVVHEALLTARATLIENEWPRAIAKRVSDEWWADRSQDPGTDDLDRDILCECLEEAFRLLQVADREQFEKMIGTSIIEEDYFEPILDLACVNCDKRLLINGSQECIGVSKSMNCPFETYPGGVRP